MKGQQAPARAVSFDDDDSTAQQQPAAEAAATTQAAAATETVQTPASDAQTTVSDQQTTTGTDIAASNNLPAVHRPKPINKEALADMGFGGLAFGFGSFPQLVLTEGEFQISTDQVSLGKQFSALLMSSAQKYIYKNTKCRKEEEDFFYSDDKETVKSSSDTVAERLAVWKEKGWDYEVKEYLEVNAQIVNCPQTPAYNGRLVLMSIPPTSIARLSGHIATMMAFGKDPREVATNICVGPKVTKAVQPFYPWQFDMPR